MFSYLIRKQGPILFRKLFNRSNLFSENFLCKRLLTDKVCEKINITKIKKEPSSFHTIMILVILLLVLLPSLTSSRRCCQSLWRNGSWNHSRTYGTWLHQLNNWIYKTSPTGLVFFSFSQAGPERSFYIFILSLEPTTTHSRNSESPSLPFCQGFPKAFRVL